MQIVIDTNVLVAGLRSRRGSAYRLLEQVGTGRFGINLSVPLVLEYEYVLIRELPNLYIDRTAVYEIIDYHCNVARHHRIYFLWRPGLRDPKDDMLMELAVTARCDSIVTYNKRDFKGAERFDVEIADPGEFLRQIGDL